MKNRIWKQIRRTSIAAAAAGTVLVGNIQPGTVLASAFQSGPNPKVEQSCFWTDREKGMAELDIRITGLKDWIMERRISDGNENLPEITESENKQEMEEEDEYMEELASGKTVYEENETQEEESEGSQEGTTSGGEDVENESSAMILENEEVTEEDQNPEETEVLLPGEIDGQPVTYRRDGDLPAGIFLILGLLAAGVFLFYPEQRMREEEKKREEELALAYSEFVAKIRVLTGAGLSLRSTWKRLAEEYEADRAKGGKRKILYEEVCRTERELSQGVLEEEVYSRFAGRIGQGAYLRLGGLLESHIRNGIRGFSALLAAESAEAFRERLQLA